MPPNPGVSNMEAWGGINAEAGETITVAWSASGDAGTGEAAQLEIYDDTGTLVETISNNTGADLVSSALPYTGRYTLRLFAGVEVITDITGSVSVSATITSSGTMSVNPIQARYDLGLTCSGTLDCGDSCP